MEYSSATCNSPTAKGLSFVKVNVVVVPTKNGRMEKGIKENKKKQETGHNLWWIWFVTLK